MAKRVFVTGMGIISAIGNNIPETFNALKSCKSGIGKIKFIDTILKDEIPAAEVPYPNEALFKLLDMEAAEGYTRTTLLGLIAVSEALSSSGFNPNINLSTGFISANTVGGMDKSEQFYYKYLRERKPDIYISTHDCGDSTEYIAGKFGLKSFVTTTSTACSSAANSILLGARMIRNGSLNRVVCGGIECLTKFHINGFNSLKILDKEACKPFDAMRNGITLGEGAGFLVLESEASISRTHSNIICELTGWGNACEAFHQTASSPEGNGAYLAMNKALEKSGLKPENIDYINAHGTGTDNNDLSEGRAIERLFHDRIPPVSSTKPYTGHTTSAAGVIESIISILGMQNNMIFPNLNFRNKMPELGFSPLTELKLNADLNHIMSNSFGFGGNNTSLIFSKYKA